MGSNLVIILDFKITKRSIKFKISVRHKCEKLQIKLITNISTVLLNK